MLILRIRKSVDLSFQIVDRIHDILVSKGMKQKDLALLLGKREAEISKWMRGSIIFTIDTLVSIEDVLPSSDIKCSSSGFRNMCIKF